MKTLGIVGGTGPESTIEYYRLIVALYRERKRDGRYPSIIINSIDMKKMLDGIERGDLPGVTEYLLRAVEQLAQAGAELSLFAANTPHIVFEEIQRRSPLPLISIVEAARDAAKILCVKKAGLFGTRFTMQGRFYPDVFGGAAIELAVPRPEEQEYIHDKYLNELTNGVFLPETRADLLKIVDRMREDEQIDSLILAGTELPLLLRGTSHRGTPFINTTEVHVKQAVAWMMS